MTVLHQLLHGYSDGHRQLAGSVRLESPRDLKRVLVFSDLSGPGRTVASAGYITGYPLQESGYYALARTWRAEEMSRPGCVWTHTLLIALADLAALSRPESLADLFVRPSSVTSQVIPPVVLDAYNVPTIVDFDRLPERPPLGVTAAIADVVRALYLHPSNAVIVPRTQFDDPEAMVLRIWGQQWPRLRRNFRFCSSVTADRSLPGESFDLQLLDGTHWGVHSNPAPSSALRTVQGLTDRWLSVSLHDFIGQRPPGLSPYLRAIGSELQSGRAAYGPLLEIFALIAVGDTASVDAVLRVAIGHEQTVASPTLNDMVVRFALAHGGPSSPSGWAFLIQHSASSHMTALSAAELRALATRFLASGWSTADLDDAATCDFIAALAPLLTGDELSTLPDAVVSRIVVLMPALASSRGFRELSRDRIETILLMSVAYDPDITADVLVTAVQVPSSPLAAICAERIDPTTLLEALNAREIQTSFDPWITHAVADLNAVATFLHSARLITKAFLELLADAGEPEWIPNAIGPDPWLSAVSDHRRDLGPCLSAHLFARGMSGKTSSSNELVSLTFGQLHGHIATSRLATKHWLWLDRVLPQLDEYRGWDRCLRLRIAMATVIQNQRLDLGGFLQLTDDDQVLVLLVMALRSQSGGKKFVRSMLKDMKGISPRDIPRAQWLRDATS